MSELTREERRAFIRQLEDSDKPADIGFRKNLIREETRDILARKKAAMSGKPAPAQPAPAPRIHAAPETEQDKIRNSRRELIRQCGDKYSYHPEAAELRASLIKQDVQAMLKGQ